MNLRICSSRSTTTASVGVCTRPTVVKKKPPSRELKAVMARVPLMPTSQSASERLRATGVLLDQAKDQLTLAARVAGVDQRAHVFALGEFDHRVQARFGFVDRLQIKEGRQHR